MMKKPADFSMISVGKGAILLLFTLWLSASIWGQYTVQAAPPKQEPEQKRSVIRGGALWIENCAPCHGITGRGDGETAASLPQPPADFTNVALARERTPAQMFEVIKNGRIENLMPPWGNQLSEQQIWDLTAYVADLSVEEATVEAGATVYAASCAECHGESGVSDTLDLTQSNSLIQISPQQLFNELQPAQGDHASLAPLSDEELWQSLAYIRTLSLDVPVLDGILQGQTINGTTGEPEGGIPVTLIAFGAAGQLIETYETVSDETGQFSFDRLNRDHTVMYSLEGVYQDILYQVEEPTVFMPESTTTDLNLNVYETTTNPAAISQSRLHRLISFSPNSIALADVFIFSNAGDATFVGSEGIDGLPETVSLALPADAINIQFRAESVRPAGDGTYIDSEPIPPGENIYTLFVLYNVPYEGDQKILETPLPYDVETVSVLVLNLGQTVSGPNLALAGAEVVEGNEYQHFTTENLAAGDPFVMEFNQLSEMDFSLLETGPEASLAGENPAVVNSNLPQIQGLNQTVLLWSILVIGLMATFFALTYRQRSQTSSDPVANLVDRKNHLLVLLSELDMLYQGGDIDENAYQAIKQKNRTLLKQVLMQMKATDGNV